MSESQTIERKTVSLPRVLNLSTKKDGACLMGTYDSEYVCNGHLAVLRTETPGGSGGRLPREPQYSTPGHMDGTIRLMLSELPKTVRGPMSIVQAVVNDQGELRRVVTTKGVHFDARYWQWVTHRCNLSICDRPGHKTPLNGSSFVPPYPVRNVGGDTVGMIMSCLPTLDRDEHLADIA